MSMGRMRVEIVELKVGKKYDCFLNARSLDMDTTDEIVKEV